LHTPSPKKIFSRKNKSALNWQIRQQRNSPTCTAASKTGVIGSSVRYRSTPRHQSRLAHRVRPRHRRPHPPHPRRRPLRRPREALLAAMEQWPRTGVPENPAAWLTATAKRSPVDDTSAHCSTTVRIGISATDGQAVNPGHGFPA
jgi:hypothetical protein